MPEMLSRHPNGVLKSLFILSSDGIIACEPVILVAIRREYRRRKR